MIHYIDARLRRWGHWAERNNRVFGLGFPSECAFMRLTPRQLGSRSDAEYNDDAEEIDGVVIRLQQERPELACIVRMFYREAGTIQDKAARIGCHRDTLYARLHQAHVIVMEMIDDLSLGYGMTEHKKSA